MLGPLLRVNMASREAYVPANGDELRDLVDRDLDADFIDDVGDHALEQGDLEFLTVPAQVELLTQADSSASA